MTMKGNRFLGFLARLILVVALLLAVLSIGSVLWLYFDSEGFTEILGKLPTEAVKFLTIDVVFITPAITLVSLLVAGHRTRRKNDGEDE